MYSPSPAAISMVLGHLVLTPLPLSYPVATLEEAKRYGEWWEREEFGGGHFGDSTKTALDIIIKRHNSSPTLSASPATPTTCCSHLGKRSRSGEYEELSPSGKRYRLNDAKETLSELGVTLTAVYPTVKLSGDDMIGNPQPFRRAAKQLMKRTKGKSSDSK